MPEVYPAAPASLSGDLLTISRFLANPTLIQRRLRTFTDLRFVSDQILTQRFRSSGGAVLYGVSEPIVNTRPVEAVSAGGEYPLDTPPTGTAAVAAVTKWGQGTILTDEAVGRNADPGTVADRVLRKVINSIIKQVDSVTISAIASAVTANAAATASWSAASGTNILRDIELAKAKIVDLNQGYLPNAILMSSTKYAYMASDSVITNIRQRETTDNPVYTGMIDVIAGLTVIAAPLTSLPSDDVWVFDTTQLGGMADEVDGAPGYSVADMAVEVQTKRLEERDSWRLWGRRKTVPVIQEPGAGFKITGS
ncbi:hypothetical protein ACQEU3_46810 [Spirillospora sp. CA-253888]